MNLNYFGFRRVGGSFFRALYYRAMCPVFLILAALVSPAMAAEPTAIVEDIAAPGARVAFMDYLFPNQVINLKKGETVTLGYLQSCLRETIAGGHILVGREKSTVTNGTVKRERVECDGGSLNLSSEQSGKSLVMVLRAPPGSSATPKPAVEIFAVSPIIKLVTGTGKISIERLDRHEDEINLTVAKGFIDLASMGRSLKPGGLYRARYDDRKIVFKVNRFARPGPGPVISRLIVF